MLNKTYKGKLFNLHLENNEGRNDNAMPGIGIPSAWPCSDHLGAQIAAFADAYSFEKDHPNEEYLF